MLSSSDALLRRAFALAALLSTAAVACGPSLSAPTIKGPPPEYMEPAVPDASTPPPTPAAPPTAPPLAPLPPSAPAMPSAPLDAGAG